MLFRNNSQYIEDKFSAKKMILKSGDQFDLFSVYHYKPNLVLSSVFTASHTIFFDNNQHRLILFSHLYSVQCLHCLWWEVNIEIQGGLVDAQEITAVWTYVRENHNEQLFGFSKENLKREIISFIKILFYHTFSCLFQQIGLSLPNKSMILKLSNCTYNC